MKLTPNTWSLIAILLVMSIGLVVGLFLVPDYLHPDYIGLMEF